MKENMKRNIRGAGMFFGAAAYGFTHMPVIVVQGFKDQRKRKKREKYYKGLKKLEEYCKELVASGRMTEEKAANLLAAAALEYVKMF